MVRKVGKCCHFLRCMVGFTIFLVVASCRYRIKAVGTNMRTLAAQQSSPNPFESSVKKALTDLCVLHPH